MAENATFYYLKRFFFTFSHIYCIIFLTVKLIFFLLITYLRVNVFRH